MKYVQLTAALCVAAAAPVFAQDGGLVPVQTQSAQPQAQLEAPAPAVPARLSRQQVVLPVNTLVQVTPAEEITSKKMKEGSTREFMVVNDVVQDGVVVIPRGSSVNSIVTWRTGKGIVGKSAKFELTFDSVRVNGRSYGLRGTWRQEGRGNTAGALLGSMIITGHSAVMPVGQIVNVFTKDPIPAL